MVDPTKITDFCRSDNDLQEFFLFTVGVAGKTASVIAVKIDQFLKLDRSDITPFEKIRRMSRTHSLGMNLMYVKLGKYAILTDCYKQVVNSGIDLRNCSIEDLEKFPGVGPKTSRFFHLHSRPNQVIACLDTHVLSYLQELGHSVPKSAPSGRKYMELERIFLSHARDLGRDPAELDLAIWNQRSKRSGKHIPGNIQYTKQG